MGTLQNEIIDYLLTLIENGRHGDMLPSQNELRDKFNVSTVTVRKALERLEARGMIYRHQGKGCFVRHPDDSPAVTRLFLIIPRRFTLSNEFIFALVNATQASTYHTIFYHYDGNDESLFHELQRITPQIVLWLAPALHLYEKTMLKLLSMPLHLILFNRNYDHPSVNSISGDFRTDGNAMGTALLKKGVRDILYLSLDMRVEFSKSRYEGIHDVVAAAGGTMTILDATREKPEIVDLDSPDTSGFAESIAKRLRQKRFDAIVCAQGELWNTMRIALAKAAVPSDGLWFGTFNSLLESQLFSPNIITVIQPIAQMAEEAVSLASRLLAGGNPERLQFPGQVK